MAAEEGTLSVIIDKVSFLKQVPWLMKATSDDENPTPGYMFKEICDISLASGSYCQALLDYLIDRLDKDSYLVKIKVLKILLYVVQNGHPDFRQGLRRRSRGVQEAAKFSGPPDPLHGNTPYTMVRKAAQELSQILFDVSSNDSLVPQPQGTSLKTSGGMGGGFQGSKMQGFGNAPNKPNKTFGEAVVSGLKEFADRIADPTDPRWTAAQQSADPFRQGNYRPANLPLTTSPEQRPEWEKSTSIASKSRENLQQRSHVVTEHRPGVAGGGWDDPVEEESPLKNLSFTRPLLTEDKHSNDSLNSSSNTPVMVTDDISESLEDVHIEDWKEEEQLVKTLVVDCRQMLPSRDKVNAFLKRCGESNSEIIITFLNNYLQTNNEQQAFRSLLLIDYLMKSDHVSIDHITFTCAVNLVLLYKTAHGPTKAKARKVIRQLQLLSGQIDLFAGMPVMSRFTSQCPTPDDPTRTLTDNHQFVISNQTALDTNSNPAGKHPIQDNSSATSQKPTHSLALGRDAKSTNALQKPGVASTDSSPEWSSLHIPFAGSMSQELLSTKSEGSVEEIIHLGAVRISSTDSQEQLEDATFERHKDSSMSEDSLKEDESVFDFLTE